MTKACGCPDSYPDWHDKDVDLGGQCVHVLPITAFLHMPLAYEAYTKRQQQAVDRLQLREPWPGLTLTQTGMFRGRIMRLLEPTESLSRHIEILPSPFHLHGHLHRGSVREIRLPLHDMSIALLEKGRMAKELYLCYLTCPQCRGDDQKDKILLLRRWVESPRLHRRLSKRALKEKRARGTAAQAG